MTSILVITLFVLLYKCIQCSLYKTQLNELLSDRRSLEAKINDLQHQSFYPRTARTQNELRNLLRLMLGYTQLLRAEPLTIPQAHYANSIAASGERMLDRIDHLEDMIASEHSDSTTDTVHRAAS